MFGHNFGILVYALLCGGDIKFKQIAEGWKWQRIFSEQEGEISKSRQSCSSTVPQPVKHRHQRMYVEVLP